MTARQDACRLGRAWAEQMVWIARSVLSMQYAVHTQRRTGSRIRHRRVRICASLLCGLICAWMKAAAMWAGRVPRKGRSRRLSSSKKNAAASAVRWGLGAGGLLVAGGLCQAAYYAARYSDCAVWAVDWAAAGRLVG